MRIVNVKQYILPQAREPGDILNAARIANVTELRSTSAAVYAASVYFLLQSMSFLGVLDKFMYGPTWLGKGGNKITMTLNLVSIFVSIFLFWSGTRKRSIGRELWAKVSDGMKV
jgi:exopolysaccharide production protein ExoQ